MHFFGQTVHGLHQILKGTQDAITVSIHYDDYGHGCSCVGACVKEEKNWGNGHMGSTLTKIAGTHLLHEAVGTVLHLTLGTDLGH